MRVHRVAIAIVFLLLLTSCAKWVKVGATQPDADREWAACEHDAELTYGYGYYSILNGDPVGYLRTLHRCMGAKGYILR